MDANPIVVVHQITVVRTAIYGGVDIHTAMCRDCLAVFGRNRGSLPVAMPGLYAVYDDGEDSTMWSVEEPLPPGMKMCTG